MIPIPQRVYQALIPSGVYGIALAIMAAMLVVQTIRIEGLSIWPVSLAGWKARAVAAETALDAAKAAYARQSAKQADIAADYERGADNARQTSNKRETEIRTIYRDIPVPDNCEPPAVVRSVLERAIADSNAQAAGSPVSLLP